MVVPREDLGAHHVFHQSLLVPDRDRLLAQLQRGGIGCAVHYLRRMHAQAALHGARVVGPLGAVQDIAARCLCLRMFPELSDAQVHRVIDSVREALQTQAA